MSEGTGLTKDRVKIILNRVLKAAVDRASAASAASGGKGKKRKTSIDLEAFLQDLLMRLGQCSAAMALGRHQVLIFSSIFISLGGSVWTTPKRSYLCTDPVCLGSRGRAVLLKLDPSTVLSCFVRRSCVVSGREGEDGFARSRTGW